MTSASRNPIWISNSSLQQRSTLQQKTFCNKKDKIRYNIICNIFYTAWKNTSNNNTCYTLTSSFQDPEQGHYQQQQHMIIISNYTSYSIFNITCKITSNDTSNIISPYIGNSTATLAVSKSFPRTYCSNNT
jgi:hypothetical protein